MRVLQIVKGLDIGNLHGGAERFASDLAISLQRKGIDVSLCAFFATNTEQEKIWMDLLQAEGVNCFFASDWKGARNIRNYLVGIQNLEKNIINTSFDICHSHFQLGTVASLILKAKGKTRKIIRTIHVTKEWENGPYGYMGEKIFSGWIFPLLIDCEVGVSKEITRRLALSIGSRIKHHKPVCIHNAIPSSNLASGVVHDTPSKNGQVIAVIGRLSEEKGHQYLFRAMKLIKEQGEKVELWVIGDGLLREDLKSLASKLGVADAIHFLGTRFDIQFLLSQIDLVVVPSLREGFPSIVLESYRTGTPVIGTDVSGIRELIIPGKSGWLVPPADAEALAEGIATALIDVRGREKAILAGRKIANDFTIDAITAQYIELYNQLLKV